MVDFPSGNFSPPQGGCSSHSTLTGVVRLVDSQYVEELEKILFTFPKRNPSFVGDLVALLHFFFLFSILHTCFFGGPFFFIC
jgi:hypothetical protein